jgi:hypothetical protein
MAPGISAQAKQAAPPDEQALGSIEYDILLEAAAVPDAEAGTPKQRAHVGGSPDGELDFSLFSLSAHGR